MRFSKRNVFLFFLFSFFIIIIYFNYSFRKVIRCDSEQIVTINNGNIAARMDAYVSVFLYKKNTGMIKSMGVISINNVDFQLNRTMYFSYQFENDTGIYSIKVHEENVNSNDTVSSSVYHAYFLPEKIGSTFFITIKKIKNNALLVSGLAYPYFVCNLN